MAINNDNKNKEIDNNSKPTFQLLDFKYFWTNDSFKKIRFNAIYQAKIMK